MGYYAEQNQRKWNGSKCVLFMACTVCTMYVLSNINWCLTFYVMLSPCVFCKRISVYVCNILFSLQGAQSSCFVGFRGYCSAKEKARRCSEGYG